MTYIGMLFIVIGAGLVLIVIGLLQKVDMAIFNFLVALIMSIGLFFMVCTNHICESRFVVAWLVLAANIYVLICEAQDGGTLKFIMS